MVQKTQAEVWQGLFAEHAFSFPAFQIFFFKLDFTDPPFFNENELQELKISLKREATVFSFVLSLLS